MSLIFREADHTAKFRAGLNGNYYVFSRLKKSVDDVAKQIGKSESSVYFNSIYRVWAIRIKLKSHKEKLKKIFKEVEE